MNRRVESARTKTARRRLLGHNPLAAIYNIDNYYRSLKVPVGAKA